MSSFYVFIAVVACATVYVPWSTRNEDFWGKVGPSTVVFILAMVLVLAVVLDAGLTLKGVSRHSKSLQVNLKQEQAVLVFQLAQLARKESAAEDRSSLRILAIAHAEKPEKVGGAVRAVLNQPELYTEEMRTRDISAAIEAYVKAEKALRAEYAKSQREYRELSVPHSKGYWAIWYQGLPAAIPDWPQDRVGAAPGN